MVVNNFNLIAPFYDRLARLIFRKALLGAQLIHIGEIGENDQVLILGGGTGEILEHFPLCENIDYVEKSHQMIRRAKRRLVNRPVNFIQEDFLNFYSERKYDIILCPFFLDCFDQSSLNTVVTKIRSMLENEGRVLVIDFDKQRVNKILLKFMLVFFKAVARLGSNKLLDIRSELQENCFEEGEIVLGKQGIFSGLYYPVNRRKP